MEEPPTKLSNEQEFIVKYVTTTLKNLLMFHETGTGKTRCAIACAKALIRGGFVRHIVIICPVSIKAQWEDTGKVFNIQDNINIYTMHAFHMNYKNLQKQQHTLLIIDEAHLFRNTEQTAAISAAAPVVFDVDAEEDDVVVQEYKMTSVFINAGIIFALTATPMLHTPSDFAIYFRLLINKPYHARNFQYTNAQFNDRFVAENGGSVDAFKMLACGLVSYYINLDKTVDHGWAPVIRTKVRVELTHSQCVLYNADTGHRRMIQKADTFKSYTRMWFLQNSDKMAEAIKFILKTKGKHVVYSNFLKNGVDLFKKRFIHELHKRQQQPPPELARYYNTWSLQHPSIITSSISIKDRNIRIETFNLSSVGIILLSAAGREGIDFKGATHMHILDLPWSHGDLLQIEGRVSRRGAHKRGETVNIITYMATAPDNYITTSDEILYDTIEKKEKLLKPYIAALRKVSIEHITAAAPCRELKEEDLKPRAEKRKAATHERTDRKKAKLAKLAPGHSGVVPVIPDVINVDDVIDVDDDDDVINVDDDPAKD
jgi:superfamily II DNA or RNA helicase